MSKPKEAVRITTEDAISYKAMDDTPGGGNLGRAEFVFCPIWLRGRMCELMIYPRQQRREDYFRLDLTDCGRVNTFSFEPSIGSTSEMARPWRMFWCKEHKGVSYEVYVPNDTDRITFEPRFGNSIGIRFGWSR